LVHLTEFIPNRLLLLSAVCSRGSICERRQRHRPDALPLRRKLIGAPTLTQPNIEVCSLAEGSHFYRAPPGNCILASVPCEASLLLASTMYLAWTMAASNKRLFLHRLRDFVGVVARGG
jgi:hypothetical protein